ncbi:DUF433 domain-containing protein [Chitinimonas arctica]|uniref:DUF433 domain-containing protein n=2 Tax=Chitinimonas arctica TaxID=2594795 RepID=A0A516SMC4_9NEIS|nr:DUF433 domain-containing protein [Chitinimonas arctica]
MSNRPVFVPTAEAAYLAELSDRQVNRMVDDQIVPAKLFEQHERGRRLFTRLSAAFARFYFGTEDTLLPAARRLVLAELTDRVERLCCKNDVYTLIFLPAEMSWKVTQSSVEIDVAPFIAKTLARMKEVDQADALVVTDPEILGGVPVFAGSRVPVDIVLASLDKGIALDRLCTSYPFLTKAHLAAARTYMQVHPRRGRPRNLAEAYPELQLRTERIVRTARA